MQRGVYRCACLTTMAECIVKISSCHEKQKSVSLPLQVDWRSNCIGDVLGAFDGRAQTPVLGSRFSQLNKPRAGWWSEPPDLRVEWVGRSEGDGAIWKRKEVVEKAVFAFNLCGSPADWSARLAFGHRTVSATLSLDVELYSRTDSI